MVGTLGAQVLTGSAMEDGTVAHTSRDDPAQLRREEPLHGGLELDRGQSESASCQGRADREGEQFRSERCEFTGCGTEALGEGEPVLTAGHMPLGWGRKRWRRQGQGVAGVESFSKWPPPHGKCR